MRRRRRQILTQEEFDELFGDLPRDDEGGGVADRTVAITCDADTGWPPNNAPCFTLSLMTEKPVSPQMKKAPDRAARGEEKPQKDPRRETRKRIREIAERHRETLDYLAER